MAFRLGRDLSHLFRVFHKSSRTPIEQLSREELTLQRMIESGMAAGGGRARLEQVRKSIQQLQNFYPTELSDAVAATYEVFGTLQFEKLDTSDVLGGLAAATVTTGFWPFENFKGTDTEEDKAIGVLYMQAVSLSHDDAANRDLSIAIVEDLGLEVAMVSATNVPAGQPLAVNRPFYLPRRANLRGRANAIAAGFRLTLRSCWVPLILGDYLPG